VTKRDIPPFGHDRYTDEKGNSYIRTHRFTFFGDEDLKKIYYFLKANQIQYEIDSSDTKEILKELSQKK
jgi:hypothetical protein